MKLFLNLVIYLNYLLLVNLSNLILLYPLIFLAFVFKDYYLNYKLRKESSDNRSTIEDKSNKIK